MTAAPADHSTELLILRKTPYQDNTLIVGGISPEYGRMGFSMGMPSGRARKAGAYFDLFQVLQVEYRGSGEELSHCRKYSVVRDYSGVASCRVGFEAACFLARFAMANILPRVSMPAFFRAMEVSLVRLCSADTQPESVLTGAGLTFLNESGLLSPQTMTPREAAQCQMLLEMASGGASPALEASVWTSLWDWTKARLLEAECIL